MNVLTGKAAVDPRADLRARPVAQQCHQPDDGVATILAI